MNSVDVLNITDVRTQPAVYTKESSVENRGNRETVETGHDLVVGRLAVFVKAFCFEVEVCGQVAAFVVATEHEEGVRVSQLNCHQIKHHFAPKAPTVHKIAQKEVLLVVRIASDFEQFAEIVKLAVHVAADGDRVVQTQQVRFFSQNRCGAVDQLCCVPFCEEAFLQEMCLQICQNGHVFAVEYLTKRRTKKEDKIMIEERENVTVPPIINSVLFYKILISDVLIYKVVN